jgi:DNA-binding HxlR family transcriptional regulator
MSQGRPELSSEIMKKCPINNTMKIVEKKFTVLILRNMLYSGQTRFNEFLETVEGINHKTLAIRLKDMVKSGLIQRKIHGGNPAKVDYALTDKGRGLLPVLEQMAAFSMRFCSTDVIIDGKPRKYSDVYGKPSPYN